MSPPPEVLTPSTCEHDLIWKQGVRNMTKLRLEYQVGLMKRRDIDTQGKCHVIMEAKIGVMCLYTKEHEVLLATSTAKTKK